MQPGHSSDICTVLTVSVQNSAWNVCRAKNAFEHPREESALAEGFGRTFRYIEKLVKVCQRVLQVRLACTKSISLEPSPDAKTATNLIPFDSFDQSLDM